MTPFYSFGCLGILGILEFKSQCAIWHCGDQDANPGQCAIQDAQDAKLAYLLPHLKDAQDAHSANTCKGATAMPMPMNDPTERLEGSMTLTTTRNLYPGVVSFIVSCPHGDKIGVQDTAWDRRGMFRHLVARHRAEIGCGCSGPTP